MILEWRTERQLPKLLDCKKGSSAIRIPCWRSELRYSYVTTINDKPITSMQHLQKDIQLIRENASSTL